MNNLANDWFTTGLLDFEYKQFILLAYLKDIRNNFRLNKLYPYYSDIVFHYKNLLSVKKNKELLQEQFPKAIKKADFEKLKIIYKKIVEDDEMMGELEQIVNYSIAQISIVLNEGKEIYNNVESSIGFHHVGLSALYQKEGYLLLSTAFINEIKAYRYQISIFGGPDEKYREIRTEYLESFTKTFTNTFENVKLELVKTRQEFSNPATFVAETKLSLPIDETLLPVAKRLVVKSVNLT